jgi:hypothetical protein
MAYRNATTAPAVRADKVHCHLPSFFLRHINEQLMGNSWKFVFKEKKQ